MLELKGITKDYKSGDTVVHALKGIDLSFRDSEFVSILGPSGCGKTTMLNIIGGLDHYNEGDLIINGTSTKKYKDRDWDAYRNHSIGFVFQSYNLIPHSSVLANVELALTLSGVGKAERRRRAVEALEKVGLGDQLNKKPNQLSGGQMQRVAIARAIVNDPEILLADEPTGALDTKTSVQIMELLKEIAKDRLIIMVTHNPELAQQYSTRIIKLLDGRVVDDSHPYEAEAGQAKPKERKRLSSMSMATAFSLSMKKLMTKKGRTFLAAFAGSIGIIGIAMILSLSNGIQEYIDKVEEDTLSAYPLTVEEKTMDMTSMMEIMAGNTELEEHGRDKVYAQNMMGKVIASLVSEVRTNNLKPFKEWLDQDPEVRESVSDVTYSYGTTLEVYLQDGNKNVKVNPFDMNQFYGAPSGSAAGSGAGAGAAPGESQSVMGAYSSAFGSTMMSETWTELPGNREMLESQFEVIAGDWADDYDECMLVVDEDNEIYDLTVYALGLSDFEELQQIMKDAIQSADTGEELELDTKGTSYSYEDILGLTYKLVLPTDFYEKDPRSGAWIYRGGDVEYLDQVVEQAMDVKISGIIRVKEDATSTSVRPGTIAYNKGLTERYVEKINESEIVKAQMADQEKDVFTGLPFESPEISYTLQDNLARLSSVSLEEPTSIDIYAKTFEDKDRLKQLIDQYNDKQEAEEDEITYSDLVGMMMSSLSEMVDIVSYVLIAFVAISLVVSSIMIAIITYISVLERTKEIGILRSVGASKKDVSHVFTAETVIEGLVSGLIGIGVTLVLNVPINIIVYRLTEVENIARLPVAGGIILVTISVLLTLIAGFFPSRMAARRDPVEALRSE